MLKILILSETDRIGSYNRAVLGPIAADPRMEITGVVVHPRPAKTRKQKIKGLGRRLRGGVFIVMLAEELQRKFQKKQPAAVRTSFPDLFSNPNLPVLRFSRLDQQARHQIASLGADIMILAGYHQIVRQPVLELFSRGVLSYHYGDMRHYRGQPPVFWEMLHGRPTIGITLQQITAGIDAGLPVEEFSVPVGRKESLATVEKNVLRASEPLMYKALCHYLEPGFTPEPLPEYGRVYTFPGIGDWLRYKIKALFEGRNK